MISRISILIFLVFLFVFAVVKLQKYNIGDLEYYIEHYQDFWRNPLLESGVPEEDLYDCMQWAFGDDWYSMQVRMLTDNWNEKHSDIFVLYGYEELNETFHKIGKEYLGELR